MPEGDTYARIAGVARPVVEGRIVLAVAGVPEIRRNADRIVGHSVTAVRTIGKHLLFDLSSEWTVHVWLGMQGEVRVSSRGSGAFVGESPPGQHEPGSERLRLDTDAGRVSVFAAPTVETERRRIIDGRLAALGPDVLVSPFDWSEYETRIQRVDPVRPVTDVLLDQRVVAGIGNEYKCEILFLERHHPLTPIGALDVEQVRGLAGRAITVMAPNVGRAKRVTTSSPARGQETWVYGRARRPCRRCRIAIESRHLGTPPRITFWCPNCQPLPESVD